MYKIYETYTDLYLAPEDGLHITVPVHGYSRLGGNIFSRQSGKIVWIILNKFVVYITNVSHFTGRASLFYSIQ